MKKLTFFSCCFVTLSLTAQVTLTQSDFPVAGNTYTLQLSDTTGVLPGNSGTSVTWNFVSSNSSVGTMVDSFKTVPATPYGASYPQANLAVHEISPSTNYFVYFNESGSSVDRVGNADPVNVITYSNPATQYLYPVSYGTSGNDTYFASYVDASSGNTIHASGTTSSNADGLGILILPSGTYGNVLRIHSTRLETDTIFTVSSGNFVVHVNEDYYLWYQAGDYYPIFHLQTTSTQVGSGPVTHRKTVGWRTGSATAGICSSSISPVILFPNPATSALHIRSVPDHLPTTISLFDLNGKLIRSIVEPGEVCEMQLADLPAGIYVLLLHYADGTMEHEKIDHQ